MFAPAALTLLAVAEVSLVVAGVSVLVASGLDIAPAAQLGQAVGIDSVAARFRSTGITLRRVRS